ncbi:unnamed protein product [Closterium sp. NIES-54]
MAVRGCYVSGALGALGGDAVTASPPMMPAAAPREAGSGRNRVVLGEVGAGEGEEAIASIVPTAAHSDETRSANSSSSSSFPLSDRTSSGFELDSEHGGTGTGSGPGERGGRGGGPVGPGEGKGGGGGGRDSWGSAGVTVAALRRLEEWQPGRCVQLVWR